MHTSAIGEQARPPGPTLREQLDELTVGRVLFLVGLPVMLSSCALVEWLRWGLDLPYSPLAITAAAVIARGL